MNKEITNLDEQSLKEKICTIRGLQVMLDRDLAELYGVKTKRLNEQVKRNIERFPDLFMFQLNQSEKDEVVAKCDHLKNLKYSSKLPYAFTEQGVTMLSAILKSNTAIKMSIEIIEAFVKIRKFISQNSIILQRINTLETKQVQTNKNFEKLFKAIESKELKPKQGIFFNGQIFDAYIFFADLIKTAQKSIILIDNYIDETVLTLFSKRNPGCKATIYTKNISRELKLDLERYNSQYPRIEVKIFTKSHDRFLIIDNKDVYHIGASLKDLGKKWFAFSRFDRGVLDILSKLKP